MSPALDVIVVGARCAGAPLAMLLARQGLRALVLDRARFPSDVISTHMLWPPGVAALHRWGVWPAIAAGGPGICRRSDSFFPGGALCGPWHAVDGVDYTISLRRFFFDAVLVDAARKAGAEVREGVVVERLLFEDDSVVGVEARTIATGSRFRERAALVVGADGRHSTVALQVKAEHYNTVPPLTGSYYTYAIDLDTDPEVAELYRYPPYEYLFIPSDQGLTLVNLVVPRVHLPAFRRDVTRNFFALFDAIPMLGERLRSARVVERVRGAVDLPNFYRRAHGPGWSLVGDAGHHKDPIRAQGMHDALLDAESLAHAIAQGLSGQQPLDRALAEYESRRDARTAFPYHICISAARFDAPDAFVERLLEAVAATPAAIAEFRGLVAGSMRPEVFFEPEHFFALTGHRLEHAPAATS